MIVLYSSITGLHSLLNLEISNLLMFIFSIVVVVSVFTYLSYFLKYSLKNVDKKNEKTNSSESSQNLFVGQIDDDASKSIPNR